MDIGDVLTAEYIQQLIEQVEKSTVYGRTELLKDLKLTLRLVKRPGSRLTFKPGTTVFVAANRLFLDESVSENELQ